MDILQHVFEYIWLALIGAIGYVMNKINRNEAEINQVKQDIARINVLSSVSEDDIRDLRDELKEIRKLLALIAQQHIYRDQ